MLCGGTRRLCAGYLCFCPFRAWVQGGARYPGCRFACPGLCAIWAFSPLLANGWAWRIYAFALSWRRHWEVRDTQGVASLALDWVLSGLSARSLHMAGCGYNRGRVGFTPYLCAVWVLSPCHAYCLTEKTGNPRSTWLVLRGFLRLSVSRCPKACRQQRDARGTAGGRVTLRRTCSGRVRSAGISQTCPRPRRTNRTGRWVCPRCRAARRKAARLRRT